MTPLTTDGWKRNLLEFRKFSSTLFPLKSSVKLDNLAIFLHSTVTVQILLISTMFLSMKQYFGDPIDCMTSGSSSDIKTSLIEHYCWLEGSFSYVEPSKIPSSYPGVRPSHHGIDDTRSHHKYYQWVYFILLIQVNDEEGRKKGYINCSIKKEAKLFLFAYVCHTFLSELQKFEKNLKIIVI